MKTKYSVTYTDLAWCSMIGMSLLDTAKWLNVPYYVVASRANKFSIGFNRKSGSPRSQSERQHHLNERAMHMAEMYTRGNSLNDIAKKYDITRERVRQILHGRFGMVKTDGGQHIKRTQKLVETTARSIKADARHITKWGCTRAQRWDIAQRERTAYQTKRNNVINRYGPDAWALTLWDYHCAVEASGHEISRGAYGLTRIDASRPFAPDNIEIALIPWRRYKK